jgi:putative addiction module component (TIGR02574 family)
MGLPKIDVQAMTPEERLDLMSRIWESFTRDPESLPLTATQAAELDRRMQLFDEGKMPTVSWDEIQARHRAPKPDAR